MSQRPLLMISALFAISCLRAEDAVAVPQVLTPVTQKTFDSVSSIFIVASCGSVSLAQAWKTHPPCIMAAHLYPFGQWLAAKGKSGAECLNDLNLRQNGFLDT